jgi:Notch-like protein
VGKNCEVDIDECLSSPCENNGNCTDGDNRYICACKDGFMGDNCETSTNDDECDVSPCQNNGKCRHQEESGLYACDCMSGYTELICESGSTSVSLSRLFSLLAPAIVFSEILECDSNPCHNGGSCIDLVAEFTCHCMAGYRGTHCETGMHFQYGGLNLKLCIKEIEE